MAERIKQLGVIDIRDYEHAEENGQLRNCLPGDLVVMSEEFQEHPFRVMYIEDTSQPGNPQVLLQPIKPLGVVFTWSSENKDPIWLAGGTRYLSALTLKCKGE